MDDYIKRSDVIDALNQYRRLLAFTLPGLSLGDEIDRVDGSIRVVKNLPQGITIVQCSECRYYDKWKKECAWDPKALPIPKDPTDWCNHGVTDSEQD